MHIYSCSTRTHARSSIYVVAARRMSPHIPDGKKSPDTWSSEPCPPHFCFPSVCCRICGQVCNCAQYICRQSLNCRSSSVIFFFGPCSICKLRPEKERKTSCLPLACSKKALFLYFSFFTLFILGSNKKTFAAPPTRIYIQSGIPDNNSTRRPCSPPAWRSNNTEGPFPSLALLASLFVSLRSAVA